MRADSTAFLRRLLRDDGLPVEESTVEVATTLGRAAAILAAVDAAFVERGPHDIDIEVWLGSTATILAELHTLATDPRDQAPPTPKGGEGG